MALSFCQQVSIAKGELFVIFLLMLVVSIPYTQDAALQQSTYGPDFYKWVGLIASLQGISVVVFAPLLGHLSDYLGRSRPVQLCFLLLLIPPFLGIFKTSANNYWYFYVSRALLSLQGPCFAVISASIQVKIKKTQEDSSYEEEEENNEQGEQEGEEEGRRENNKNSSSSSEQQETLVTSDTGTDRFETFSLGVAAFILGALAGSVVGTGMGDDIHLKFIVMVGLTSAALLYTTIFGVGDKQTQQQQEIQENADSEESLPFARQHEEDQEENERTGELQQHQQQQQSAEASNDGGGEGGITRLCRLLRNKSLVVMLLIVFFDFLAEQALQALLLNYMHQELNANEQEQMALLLTLGICCLIALFFVSRYLPQKMSMVTILRISLIANGIAVSCITFETKVWQMCLSCSLTLLGILVFSSSTTLATLTVEDRDSGIANGLLAASRFLAEAMSPAIFGIFLQFTKGSPYPGPGSPFSACGVSCFFALGLTFLLPAKLGATKKTTVAAVEAN